jgi:hypothetical protein
MEEILLRVSVAADEKIQYMKLIKCSYPVTAFFLVMLYLLVIKNNNNDA